MVKPKQPKRGVQYAEVAPIADDLAKRGERPTADKVRKVLGRGSKSTLNAHVLQWAAHQGCASAAPALGENLVRAMLGEIHQHVEASRTKLAVEIETLRECCSELVQDLKLCEEELDEAKEQIEVLNNDHARLSARIDQKEIECQAVSDRCATLVRELARQDVNADRISGVESERDRLKDRLDEERTLRHAAELRAAELDAKLAAMEWRLADSKERTAQQISQQMAPA